MAHRPPPAHAIRRGLPLRIPPVQILLGWACFLVPAMGLAQTLVVDPETGKMTTEGDAPAPASPAPASPASASPVPASPAGKPFRPFSAAGMDADPNAALAAGDPLLQDSTLMQSVRLGTAPNIAIVAMTRSAQTGAAAKQQVRALAKREGLQKIFQQQAPERAKALMELLDPTKIDALVTKIGAMDEQTTASTYKAVMTLQYDAAQLQKMLGEGLKPLPDEPAAPPLVPGAGKASLVIPVWEEGGQPHIWEGENPWRRALNRAALQESKGKLVMPYGDPIDQLVITDVKLPGLDFAEVAQLTARYGTADVMVARAVPVGGNAVNLTLTRLDAKGKTEQQQLIAAAPGVKRDDLLAKAATTLAQLARTQFQSVRESEVRAADAEHTVRALAPILRATDWVSMRQQLLALPMISALTPVDIGPERVEMDLTFRGTPDAFGNALKAAHIHVTPQGDKLVLGFYETSH